MSESNDPFPDKNYKAHEFARTDMSGVKFNGVDLTDSHFWAVLKHAQFNDCNLNSAKFEDINLASSSFDNINLSYATFNDINMTGVMFSNLNLKNVEITNANLEGLKIDGILVTDLLEVYKRNTIGDPNTSEQP